MLLFLIRKFFSPLSLFIQMALLLDRVRFIPQRARTLVVEYAKPRLIDWRMPTGAQMDIVREEQFGMIASVRSGSVYNWAMVGETFSTVTEWSAKLEASSIFLGVTNRSSPWFHDGSENDTISSCIELRRTFTSDDLILARVNLDGSGHASSSSNIYLCGREFKFVADPRSNLLSVSFDGHRVQAVVSDLASFRPFCHFCSFGAAVSF